MRRRTTGNDFGVVHPLVEKALASKPPVAELIGFDVGGVLCDAADAAMGMAFVSTLALSLALPWSSLLFDQQRYPVTLTTIGSLGNIRRRSTKSCED